MEVGVVGGWMWMARRVHWTGTPEWVEVLLAPWISLAGHLVCLFSFRMRAAIPNLLRAMMT